MVIYFYSYVKKNGYMSNFYPSKFTISADIIGLSDILEAETAEQAIMWFKALLMGDKKKAKMIAFENNPLVCKKYGREVYPYNEEKWETNREMIAFKILKTKFEDPKLKKWLLETNNEILAEANPTDKIWGIGLNMIKAIRGDEWNGRNILGNTLMRVRDHIKNTIIMENI